MFLGGRLDFVGAAVGRALGRVEVLGAAMSVSYDDGDGANSTGEFYFWVPNRAPTEQARDLSIVGFRTRVTQCARVNDAQATQEVLRVIWINHIPADT
jgi:hypothetical protein